LVVITGLSGSGKSSVAMWKACRPTPASSCN
jgi:adenylylsulfate kinase-like enzyme